MVDSLLEACKRCVDLPEGVEVDIVLDCSGVCVIVWAGDAQTVIDSNFDTLRADVEKAVAMGVNHGGR